MWNTRLPKIKSTRNWICFQIIEIIKEICYLHRLPRKNYLRFILMVFERKLNMPCKYKESGFQHKNHLYFYRFLKQWFSNDATFISISFYLLGGATISRIFNFHYRPILIVFERQLNKPCEYKKIKVPA